MEWITYSWLSCCASAPSVAAVSVWVLFIFHTYRRRWRTMDIFLLTIALQEIPNSLCAFGFAVQSVIRSRSESSCQLVIWGLTTTRVFQLTTLASLAFDRALTLKWPYKYRFSVRHSQIRYHIVVLGVISSLVGIAGLFARLQFQDFQDRLNAHTSDVQQNSSDSYLNQTTNKTISFYCTLHPFSWDFRYNVFISSLYAVLAAITLFCTFYIEIKRYRGSGTATISRTNSRISSVGNLCGDHLTPAGDPLARCESYRTLYGFQPTAKHGSINKKILDDQRAFDLRWPPVVGTLALCYALNHGPYLAFSTAGLVIQFWNPLHDNIVIWFGVIEGILLPIALYITDDPFRDAVKRSFRRKSYRCSDISKSIEGPFPLYFNDFALIDKPYVGAMSSIPTAKLNTSSSSPLTVVSNYRRSSMRANEKHRRTNINESFMRTNNNGLQSLRKSKSPKSNDKYMFLSIYGVDKVIPVNKPGLQYNTSNSQDLMTNPYSQSYKNNTTMSTFAGSVGSIQKLGSDDKSLDDKQQHREASNNDSKIWYSANSGKHFEHKFNSNLIDNNNKSSKAKYANDDHIYATLSETFSVRSTLPDKRQLQQTLQTLNDSNDLVISMDGKDACNDANIQNTNSIISTFNSMSTHNYGPKSIGTASIDGLSMSGVSFTTLANDDFEFTKGSDSQTPTTDRTLNDETINDCNDNTSVESSSSSTSSSGSYTMDKTGSRSHIYDNLAFECHNSRNSASVAKAGTKGYKHSRGKRHASHASHMSSSVLAMNYLQRNDSSIVGKSVNKSNVYYKPKGRQSFSTSDIHKIDSNIYSMPSILYNQINGNHMTSFKQNIANYTNHTNAVKNKRSVIDNQINGNKPSQPRKTVSETNLLTSSTSRQSLGSLTRIDEHQSKHTGVSGVHLSAANSGARGGRLYHTQSSDSLESNTSSESSTTNVVDTHSKLASVINKRKANVSLAAIRNNSRSRSRTKKYRNTKREDSSNIINNYMSRKSKDVPQNTRAVDVTKQKINSNNNNNMFGSQSQSVWSIDSKPIVRNLNGLTRIGSYAQEWYLNKSMPDLCSLDSLDNTCPSPVFSPLYKRESTKKIDE